MPSNDGIMIQRYYEGTTTIVNLAIEIGKLLGQIDASFLRKPKTTLRRKNRIQTIQSSLSIEGNTLSLEQVTAIFEKKRVIGSAKEIREVQNAIAVYERLRDFDPLKQTDYLEAHRLLMQGLIEKAGTYRTQGVGIFKGEQVAHVAPPAWNVQHLMDNLFSYLKDSSDNLFIKSCVFHYEMEFVHPFMDGNGRMGRLWQTLLLIQENPVFEFLPIEIEIRNNQQGYYQSLAQSDQSGLATTFVEFMLQQIKHSLEQLLQEQQQPLVTALDRIAYFREHTTKQTFSRKDYMLFFKNISSATATRDLRKGVAEKWLLRKGQNRLSSYTFIENE